MPPTEHTLIHELSTGAAKVILSSDWRHTGFWLVTRNGAVPKREHLMPMFEWLLELHDEEPEDIHPLAADQRLAE